ncbi:MAG: aromatic ring-hydroxylating dioxygenase subunit alpha [bacterium]|nr:aromatic ring-hydroxylating dioxygenase subunit alpha [bacterium]
MSEILTAAEIAAVREQPERASLLPARCYTDPDFYELEKERMFRRSWLAVGRAEQIANPGDYFNIDLFGEPLILVHDQGGTIRALSNICPHRWMLLVGHDEESTFPFKSQSCGNRNSFQCPFHLWSFDLEGKMLGAPGMEQAQDFDKKRWSLPQFPAELWGGFIFVNLDTNAAPLAPQLAPLVPEVEGYELERLRMLEPIDYDCDWNWKMSVEAGSESYHHIGLHQDIIEDLMPGAMSEIEPPRGPYSLYWNPTKDRSPIPGDYPPPAGLSERELYSLKLVTIFPYTMFFMVPGYTAYLQLIPDSHDHHRLRYIPLVHPNIDQHPDPEKVGEDIRALLDAVHQQDMAGGRYCWAGAQSRLAKPGRVSHLETQLWQMHNWLLDQIEKP